MTDSRNLLQHRTNAVGRADLGAEGAAYAGKRIDLNLVMSLVEFSAPT
ncbi:uncharacterized protein METZ01_LOCUS420057, partial [marine metagenome]